MLNSPSATPVVCDSVSLVVFGQACESLVAILYLLCDVYNMYLQSISRYARISYKKMCVHVKLARYIIYDIMWYKYITMVFGLSVSFA